MTLSEQVQLGIISFIILLLWAGLKLCSYLKRRKVNRELWATVFEGMTQKLVNLDLLKVPESYIEKKSPRNGKDRKENED